ncbi:hypothetical protein P0D88_34920 [Paraburkholderia sp. RL18-103-BIB-C]|uniref:hypothetical protein n=1 Tax=Paraburkholderia sp. RL18-103-BIB-C TaxID=3031637 RepID=UPI0038BDFA08
MKKTDLENFAKRTAPADAVPVDPKTGKAPRGSQKRVGIMVRVTPEDWPVLTQFAVAQRKSMAALFIEGMQMLMEARNTKPIKNGK